MIKTQQEKFFVCKCDCISHLIRVTFDEWDGGNELVIASILNYAVGFWQRVKIAFKYVFGIHNDWPYDAALLDEAQARELRDFLNSTILKGDNIR